MWGQDGQIYFSSEQSGIFNIWRIAPTGGEPQQVTTHRSDGVQFPSMSPDGTTIAYENEFEIWTLAVGDRNPTRVPIDLAFDPNLNPVTWVTAENEMDGFDITPKGDYAAIDFHGEIFLVPTDPEVGEKRQVTDNSWRQRRANVSPDGRYVAYTSDETKEEEIWVFDRETGDNRKLTSFESFKADGEWSPDESRIAWTGDNRLFVTDVASAQTTELAYNVAGGYTLRQFSPDGQWLVYDRRDEDQNYDVFLFDVGARREVNVTPSLFSERQGTLTPDATHVLFISERDGSNQIWSAPLSRQTEDPDDPVVRERLRQAEEAEESEDQAPPSLTVDTDGIDDRAVQITDDQPVRGFFLSEDGETIYFLSSDDDGSALFSVGIDGGDATRLVAGQFSGLTPTKDRSRIFYTQGGGLWQMPLRGQREGARVPFEVTVRIDRREEWAQIFDESWRVMKYRFYDPDMHGRDWAAIKARYEPLLPYVGENNDVYDLANEMIGELNASHTGVRGGPTTPQPSAYQTRYLGFEMMPENGGYAVTHIYRDGPADKEWIDIALGEYVTAIDGTPIKAGDNYWRLLNSPLNDYVTVTVASSPDGAGARDLRIRTVNSLQNIKYEEWVAKNREVVDETTDGQIAYVHIRSMNQSSLARFETEINHYWNKKGIIVDIRYNGGGNIDQQLIDILERRPYEFWNSRYGAPTWGRRPRQAIAGPKVMMINARSGSDSEVTPQAFRDLRLGRIVGNPTAAAVIATGSYGLIHGGTIRTPGSLVVTYDPERPDNHGINLENFGVVPDVWVENTPEDELAGEDRELEAAIAEAMKMLSEGLWQYRGGGGR
jgi:tricorn protease